MLTLARTLGCPHMRGLCSTHTRLSCKGSCSAQPCKRQMPDGKKPHTCTHLLCVARSCQGQRRVLQSHHAHMHAPLPDTVARRVHKHCNALLLGVAIKAKAGGGPAAAACPNVRRHSCAGSTMRHAAHMVSQMKGGSRAATATACCSSCRQQSLRCCAAATQH